MATNQYDYRYGYDPTDLRSQKMTNDLMTRPEMDPTYKLMNDMAQPGYGGASSAAEVAAAGLRRDDVPGGGVMGGVAGGLPGATGYFGNQPQSASWLGGANGPNAVGNANNPMSANQAWSSWGNTNQDMQSKDPLGFALGRNKAYEDAQKANLNGATVQSNDQYINSNGAWIRNPDFNPLQELRGMGNAVYGMDNSIANKSGYQSNGFNYQREDPFAGQNLNDASVQFQLKQYMQTHPNFVPINTYKGEAPRLPGEINQDTGMRTMEGVSGQNPWITNKGFVQQMPWQGQQQQQAPYQAPQAQQTQNLQPFQQTSAYQNAMSQNWSSPIQQPQNNFGNQNMQQQGQPSFGNPQNNFGGGQSQGFGNLQNNFQSMYQNQQPQQQQSFGQNGFGGNRFGLKSAYGTR